MHGVRLDVALAELFSSISRSRLQQWIRDGLVSVDGACITSTRLKLTGGESLSVIAPDMSSEYTVEAQPVDLAVIHEDEHIAVIDKTPGLVMHIAPGNPDGTVQNGLLYRYPRLAGIPRNGIVHRLDKDTSGLFVVALTLEAHKALVDQLQARTMGRRYTALVHGKLIAGGKVDAPIGRHPKDRKRMAVVSGGREAVTHYRVLDRFEHHTLLEMRLETGRTHQIRVHMASIKHPLVGDPVYGLRGRSSALNEQIRAQIDQFPRQALHAHQLTLLHPGSGQSETWESPMPDDLKMLIDNMKSSGTVS
jgi:23S rRNA pseudouridine1911/1915/1917 synthase